MYSIERLTKPPMKLSAVILAALVAGCGGGGDSESTAAGASKGMLSVTARQAPVDLRSAGTFAVLTKSGITNVIASIINGDVGASPITGAAILLTCGEVKTGKIYSVDAAGPLPCVVNDAPFLTSAVLDMEAAYTDAAGRANPNFTELGGGEIGGLTLVPGLYKWGTDVNISTDVTLTGTSDDVFIFQISKDLQQAFSAPAPRCP